MAIQVVPLPLPASADRSKSVEFGREVKGVDLGTLTDEQFQVIRELLFKVSFTVPSRRSERCPTSASLIVASAFLWETCVEYRWHCRFDHPA